jgi:hypothetical protein
MRLTKILVFWVVILVLVAVSAEGFSYVFAQLYPEQFRPDTDAIRTMADPDSYADWLRYHYDAELGWINPSSMASREKNCAGELVSYTFDKNGARGSQEMDRVDVVAVGDSFTRGDDVNDTETYPFWIQKLTGLTVANYGVGATDPLQQVMYLERLVHLHPELKIAILGIWYEDLRRLPNQLYLGRGQGWPFFFKPYVDVTLQNPMVRPNPNAPPAPTVDRLIPLVEKALNTGYLRRPSSSWPYTVSIVKLLESRLFIYSIRNRVNQLFGRDVLGWWEDQNLLKGLEYVVRRFSRVTRAHEAVPVVVFIPNGVRPRYAESPSEFMRSFRSKAGADHVLFVNVGEADIDWERYNVVGPDGHPCHASAYGYEMIARAIVEKLEAEGIVKPHRYGER